MREFGTRLSGKLKDLLYGQAAEIHFGIDHDLTTLRGWVFSPAGLPKIVVAADGEVIQQTRAHISRPDVNQAFPTSKYSFATGFEIEIPISGDLRVYAVLGRTQVEIWSRSEKSALPVNLPRSIGREPKVRRKSLERSVTVIRDNEREKLPENIRTPFVCYVSETVVCTEETLSNLLQTLLSEPTIGLVRPGVYGGQETLPRPPVTHVEHLTSNYVPTLERGPVWMARTSFLDSSGPYHFDLSCSVFVKPGVEERCSKEGRLATYRLFEQWGSLPWSSEEEEVVYVALPPNWSSIDSLSAHIAQLKEEGAKVILVADIDSLVSPDDGLTISGCEILDGYVVHSVLDMVPSERNLQPGTVLAVTPDSLPVAAALEYVTESKLVKLYQDERPDLPQEPSECVSVILAMSSDHDAPVDICAERLKAYLPADHELVIVNDDPESIAAACTPKNDVVIVRPDVLVTKGVFEGLREAAYSDSHVGIAAPLSTHSLDCNFSLLPPDDLDEGARFLRENIQPTFPTVLAPKERMIFVRRSALKDLRPDSVTQAFMNGVKMVCADNVLVSDHRTDKRDPNSDVPGWWRSAHDEFTRRDPLSSVREAYSRERVLLEQPPEQFSLQPYLGSLSDYVKDLQKSDEQKDILDDIEVVFVLDSAGVGGGSLSVMQHVNEMIKRGIRARVISLTHHTIDDFPALAPVITVSHEELFNLNWSNQKVVATYWLTAHLVARLKKLFPGIDPYHYVQDYEPRFYSESEQQEIVDQARSAYELGLPCIAKTDFLCQTLKEQHDIEAQLITPGLARTVFYPGAQEEGEGRIQVAAMFRKSTARRCGKEMLKVFSRVVKQVPTIQIKLFGDIGEVRESLKDNITFLGRLPQREVANLYRESDIVVDLSSWHGFGRMGIEGMACGAVPVLTRSGGVDRYAVHEQNALLVDVSDTYSAVTSIVELARDRRRRLQLRSNGIESLTQFSEELATDDWLTVLGLERQAKACAYS